jgi:hypothetical protein
MKRSKKAVLDVDFLAARASLLDLAAFADRVDRADGEADFRFPALLEAISLLAQCKSDRVRRVLEALSYPDGAIDEKAGSKAACGAPNLNK